MKRLLIDEDLCQGTRECAALARDAIAFDADGVAVPVGGPLDDALVDRIASTCPSMAISAIDL